MEAKNGSRSGTDPKEIMVLVPSQGPEYTGRTAGGESRRTGIPDERIGEIRVQDVPRPAYRSAVPYASGKPFSTMLETMGA